MARSFAANLTRLCAPGDVDGAAPDDDGDGGDDAQPIDSERRQMLRAAPMHRELEIISKIRAKADVSY